MPHVSFPCARCGKRCVAWQRPDRHPPKYCSRACYQPVAGRKRTCDGCGREFIAKKLHSNRRFCSRACWCTARRNQPRARTVTLEEMTALFHKSVDRTSALPCWLWTGRRLPTGYGILHRTNKLIVYAHRFAYELRHGTIPTGLTIDHLCFNTSCVNSDHLEAVTQSENSRRYMVNKHWPERRRIAAQA